MWETNPWGVRLDAWVAPVRGESTCYRSDLTVRRASLTTKRRLKPGGGCVGLQSRGSALNCVKKPRRQSPVRPPDPVRATGTILTPCRSRHLRQQLGTLFARTRQTVPGVGRLSLSGEPCGRQDSNLHGLPHGILNPARLPIPPRPRTEPIRLSAVHATRTTDLSRTSCREHYR